MIPGREGEAVQHTFAVDSSSPYLADAYAEHYDEDRFGGAFGRYLREQEITEFRAMIDETAGTVLDVGAGTGKLGLALAENGRLVVSADVSLAMLRIAGRQARQRGVRLATVVCDAHHLCFRDRSFDWVVSSRLLMHLPSWPTAVRELTRVARRAVVMDYPPRSSFAGLWASATALLVGVRSGRLPYRALGSRRVRRELYRYRFGIACLRRSYFLPIACHRWLNRPTASSRIEAVCRRLGLTKVAGAPALVKALRQGDQRSSPRGVRS